MPASRRIAFYIVLVFILLADVALAAHPLVTEDTGTQGVGNAELEHGFSWQRTGADQLFAFQPQLSFGLTPTLDVLVQPGWLYGRPAASPSTRGLGDTAWDVKWRYYGNDPLSLAVRAGLLLPTSQHGLGLPQGRVATHSLLVATFDAAPWTLHGNLGLVRNPDLPDTRQYARHVSAAALWARDERWTVTIDAGLDTHPDPSRSSWQGLVLAGIIYTVRPGFDVDIGLQKSARANPASRQWLLGLTYRWAP